jgi:hypothetical protein
MRLKSARRNGMEEEVPFNSQWHECKSLLNANIYDRFRKAGWMIVERRKQIVE